MVIDPVITYWQANGKIFQTVICVNLFLVYQILFGTQSRYMGGHSEVLLSGNILGEFTLFLTKLFLYPTSIHCNVLPLFMSSEIFMVGLMCTHGSTNLPWF
jgi:hypothetical protein